MPLVPVGDGALALVAISLLASYLPRAAPPHTRRTPTATHPTLVRKWPLHLASVSRGWRSDVEPRPKIRAACRILTSPALALCVPPVSLARSSVRSTLHQHHPRARGGYRPEVELRTPGSDAHRTGTREPERKRETPCPAQAARAPSPTTLTAANCVCRSDLV